MSKKTAALARDFDQASPNKQILPGNGFLYEGEIIAGYFSAHLAEGLAQLRKEGLETVAIAVPGDLTLDDPEKSKLPKNLEVRRNLIIRAGVKNWPEENLKVKGNLYIYSREMPPIPETAEIGGTITVLGRDFETVAEANEYLADLPPPATAEENAAFSEWFGQAAARNAAREAEIKAHYPTPIVVVHPEQREEAPAPATPAAA